MSTLNAEKLAQKRKDLADELKRLDSLEATYAKVIEVIKAGGFNSLELFMASIDQGEVVEKRTVTKTEITQELLNDIRKAIEQDGMPVAKASREFGPSTITITKYRQFNWSLKKAEEAAAKATAEKAAAKAAEKAAKEAGKPGKKA